MTHPCCRIPPLALDAPVVLTASGGLRPERAVLYNRPFLLLHHYAACQPPERFPLDEAVMAGLSKTATRLWALLTKLEATHHFQPLWWERPEDVCFALTNCGAVAAAAKAQPLLVQAERLDVRTLGLEQVLEFRRC